MQHGPNFPQGGRGKKLGNPLRVPQNHLMSIMFSQSQVELKKISLLSANAQSSTLSTCPFIFAQSKLFCHKKGLIIYYLFIHFLIIKRTYSYSCS